MSSLDGAESFLETPAVAKIADMFEVETKKLECSEAVRHYKIVSHIGTGGMGEVYPAEDTHLNGKVALKLLSVEFQRTKSNHNMWYLESTVKSIKYVFNVISE